MKPKPVNISFGKAQEELIDNEEKNPNRKKYILIHACLL